MENQELFEKFKRDGDCWHDTEDRYVTHTTGGNWAYDSIEHHYAPRCSKCGKKNPKNIKKTKIDV